MTPSLNDRILVEKVAESVYKSLYKSEWESAAPEARAESRADARTIISAFICGQTAEDAAKRLATWLWVDRKKPHVPWNKADESVKRIMTRKAQAGWDALLENYIWRPA